MILADKIIEERKKLGWSQEELADKLDVSRQSVSKWESAQSIPDINRILQMAEIFCVSTDYLLKDDAVKENVPVVSVADESRRNAKKISMEEAAEFISTRKKVAPVIALGVSMCIASPILLIALSGLVGSTVVEIAEGTAVAIGLVVLLIMVATAVYMFISSGSKLNKYKDYEIMELETAYGIDGMAKEKRKAYEGTFNKTIALGVIMCILSCVPLIVTSLFSVEEYIITAMVGVMLLIIAIAVNMFIRVGMENGSYNILLQDGDYSVSKKRTSGLMSKIDGAYWMTVVAIYLSYSFISGKWEISWVVWPIAGVLFPALRAIVNIFVKEE